MVDFLLTFGTWEGGYVQSLEGPYDYQLLIFPITSPFGLLELYRGSWGFNNALLAL